MTIQAISNYIELYGYLIIFVFLFFGVVGIPAPEESLLFLIGVLVAHHKLAFGYSVFYAVLGVFSGMLTAYVCGRFVGYPFINRFGKYVGITVDRWEKAKHQYTKNFRKTLVFGFYMPGLRQISPYFAGIANIRFPRYFLYSLLGTICWAVPFIVAGFYAGDVFDINPMYVPYLGILFLFIFIMYVSIKYVRKKRR
ncbi:DedA family protein [Peribacillus glennii]|uniref:DedA family protein n=1 Tax=Peribacillus glennii TaxID=2303991 RepID=A0A372LFV6_9BACI|nr:DedA family protein [Peribacillus glennii]RFU64894.1 DedA family protein [Peribacillus glennii]